MVDAVPPVYQDRMIPYLMIDGASAAIDFYTAAFGAQEQYRMPMPDGKVGHAEIVVHGAPVFLADAPDDMPGASANPTKLGGSSVLLHQYVEDVDATVAKAVAAGATVVRAPEDQFYGDRAALVSDPFGHLWSFHTHIKDMTPEDMQRAMEQLA